MTIYTIEIFHMPVEMREIVFFRFGTLTMFRPFLMTLRKIFRMRMRQLINQQFGKCRNFKNSQC